MSEKVWTALYLGKEIRVSSRTSWLPAKNRQTLTIDGRVIALQQKGWRSIPACLRAPYQFEDQELWVEVLIGYSGLRRAYRIWWMENLVGGDTPKKIRALTYQQWQEIQRKGLGRFLLVEGCWPRFPSHWPTVDDADGTVSQWKSRRFFSFITALSLALEWAVTFGGL